MPRAAICKNKKVDKTESYAKVEKDISSFIGLALNFFFSKCQKRVKNESWCHLLLIERHDAAFLELNERSKLSIGYSLFQALLYQGERTTKYEAKN